LFSRSIHWHVLSGESVIFYVDRVTIKEMEMKAKSRRKAVGVFMGDLPLKEKNRRSW
jgi:hypothetical protein